MLTLVVFSICLVAAIFWNARRKHHLVLPSSLLLLAYLFSAFSGIYLLVGVETALISPLPSLALGLGLFLFLQPLIAIDERRFCNCAEPDNRKLTYLSIALITGGIICMFRFAPLIPTAFVGDLDANRTQVITGQGLVETPGLAGAASVLTSIAVLAAFMFPIMLTLAFYYLTTGRSRIISALLLISSVSYVVYTAANVGRDGFIFWTAAFAFNCLIFWRNITLRIRWLLVATTASFLAIFAVGFLAITSDRFGSKDHSLLYYQISYAGDSFVNFSELVMQNLKPGLGQLHFPVVYRVGEIFGICDYNPDAQRDYADYCLAANYTPNVFSTFLGSLVADFGVFGMLGCALIFNTTARFVFRRTWLRPTISFLIFYLFLTQVMFEGVFYFVRYTQSGNGSIILMVLLCIWLRKPASGRKQMPWRKLFRPEGARDSAIQV